MGFDIKAKLSNIDKSKVVPMLIAGGAVVVFLGGKFVLGGGLKSSKDAAKEKADKTAATSAVATVSTEATAGATEAAVSETVEVVTETDENGEVIIVTEAPTEAFVGGEEELGGRKNSGKIIEQKVINHSIVLDKEANIIDNQGAVERAKAFMKACETVDYDALWQYTDCDMLVEMMPDVASGTAESKYIEALDMQYPTLFMVGGMEECTIYKNYGIGVAMENMFSGRGEDYESFAKGGKEAGLTIKPIKNVVIDDACMVKSNHSKNFFYMLHINGNWYIDVMTKYISEAMGMTKFDAVETPDKAQNPTNANGDVMTGEESARAAAALYIRACKAKDYATLANVTNIESILYAIDGAHYSGDELAVGTKKMANANSNLFTFDDFKPGEWNVEPAKDDSLDLYKDLYEDDGEIYDMMKAIYPGWYGFKDEYTIDGACYLVTPMRKLVLLHINNEWVVDLAYLLANKSSGYEV